MTNTIKRLKYELETTKATLTTQTQKLAEAHRQIDQEAAKGKAITKSLQAEEKRHRASRDELQKAKINLQTVKTQYAVSIDHYDEIAFIHPNLCIRSMKFENMSWITRRFEKGCKR